MTKYVLGFAFDENKSNVLLIKKTKPDWQAGLYNGIGGKIEVGESAYMAMVREFEEECAIQTTVHDWTPVIVMKGTDQDGNPWEVHTFQMIYHNLSAAQTTTDELVSIFDLHTIFFNKFATSKVISNIPWLISMCLDEDVSKYY